jgi:hypothetical protein
VPADVKAAAARLDGIPTQVGDWRGEELPTDERQMAVAEADGWVSRRYTNQSTGESVSVLILCGRPGPLGCHTPDICYRGQGFLMTGGQHRRTLPISTEGEPAEAWTGRFRRQYPTLAEIEVSWAWGTAGRWRAPDDPHLAFAGGGVVYKLYVSRPLPPGDAAGGPDPTESFLREFLPLARDCLTPPG